MNRIRTSKQRFFKLLLFSLFLVACKPVIVPSLQESRRALSLIDQGTQLLRERELERAEGAFQMAFELSGLPQALDGLGCIAFLRNDDVAAEHLFRQAYGLDPGYVNALSNLALLYERQGQIARAELLYKLAMHGDPQNVRGRNNYSALLFDNYGKAPARQELLKARALADSPTINANLNRLDPEESLN